jgi:hypothetical protein
VLQALRAQGAEIKLLGDYPRFKAV